MKALEKPQEANARQSNLLTRRQLADRLQLCTHSIRRLELRGALRALRINGRVVRYDVNEIERFLAQAQCGE